MVQFKILFLSVFTFINLAHADEVQYYPIADLKAELPKTLSVVFDDNSEKLYGDLLDHKAHLDLICEVIQKMEGHEPKAIFIDVDVTMDLQAAACIVEAATKLNIPLTIDFDPNVLSAATQKKLDNVSIGSAAILTKVMDGFDYQENQTPGVTSQWLNPNSRVSHIKPAAIPYRNPAYFINLVNGVADSQLRKINISWARNVWLTEFSEVEVPKISFQEVLSGHVETASGKFVLIGVDQDKYDSMSNAQGEIVNGVFIHQYLTAAYLALLAKGEVAPKEGSIIFGPQVNL